MNSISTIDSHARKSLRIVPHLSSPTIYVFGVFVVFAYCYKRYAKLRFKLEIRGGYVQVYGSRFFMYVLVL